MSAVLERTIPKTAGNGVKPRLITVAEYDWMIQTGIYTKNDCKELLNGEIVQPLPKGPKHVYFNEAIAEFLKERLGKTVDVRSQNPIVLDDFSEPEPDIVLAKPERENYLGTPRRPPILCLSWKSPTRLGLTTAKTKPLPIPAAASGNISRSNLQNETLEDYREPG